MDQLAGHTYSQNEQTHRDEQDSLAAASHESMYDRVGKCQPSAAWHLLAMQFEQPITLPISRKRPWQLQDPMRPQQLQDHMISQTACT